MKLRYQIAVSLIITALTCMPAFGQLDLTRGSADELDFQLGIFADSAEGNQNTVREYDGRNFTLWGLDAVDAYGYKGTTQYWFSAHDLFLNQADVSFDLNSGNNLSLHLGTNSLTHRYTRIPEINPYLEPLGFSVMDPPAGDAFTDNTPDGELGIDRRVNSFDIRYTPCSNVALVGEWSQEQENGALQGMYYYPRQSVDFLIDRSTDESVLGADIKVGDNSVINYRFENNEFREDAGVAVIPDTYLDRTVIPNIKTKSNVIKARSKLTDQLYFTGAYVNRIRTNETTTLMNDPSINVRSTNAALTFLAGDTLTITSRYRNHESDSNFDPIFSNDLLSNYQHNRDQRSIEVEASFTGIPRTRINAGFERRTTDRVLNSSYEPEYIEYNLAVNESTKANIVNVGVRCNPTPRFSFSGGYETWSITDPGYKSSPTDRTRINANATYLAADNLAFYGNYNKSDESNNLVHIAFGDIPVTATDEGEEVERIEAAGQGYNNDTTTSVVGLWYAVSPRLTMDVNYGRNQIDSNTTWIIGFEIPYPPHLAADVVPFMADYSQLSAGLNYSIGPNSQVYGRYMTTDSTGKSLVEIIPGDPVLTNGWTPVSIAERRWTVGFTHRASSKERILVEFSLADWNDRIDPNNSGQFDLVRVAWSTSH